MDRTLYRRTLTSQIAEHLGEYINTHGLQPGDFLASVSDLAQEFDVSRSVIREALKILEGQGSVTMINGRGAMVQLADSTPLALYFARGTQGDDFSVLCLMEVRKGLEVEAASLAARRATKGEIDRIAELAEALERHLHDPQAFVDTDLALHLTVAAASHNPLLYQLMVAVRPAIERTIRGGLESRTVAHRLDRACALHAELVVALKAQRPEEAARLMAMHFDETMADMMADGAVREPSARAHTGRRGGAE